jgi:GTP-binding protein Era
MVSKTLDCLTARALDSTIVTMDFPETPAGHRSGFIALAGRPNVGKSTLVNAYLGQYVAAVSPRPQTTRRRQLGILTLANAQVIFVDTPGIHQPMHKLGQHMVLEAQEVLEDADLILVIFSLKQSPQEDDKMVAERVLSIEPAPPILIALNMLDHVSPDDLPVRTQAYQTLMPGVEALAISATRGDQRDRLLERIVEMLPLGPRYYPEEDVTDLFERDIAADLIRAAALKLLRDEVPHGIAVRIDEFKERNGHGAYIEATLFVERNSQKGIVIGKGGLMLREIGTMARKEIETMSGRKTYLQLRVKVLKGWRNDPGALRRLGFEPEDR